MKRKRRFLGILLGLALMMGLMLGMSLTAHAVSYDLYIGDTGYYGDASGEGWAYNASAKTLTLTDFDNNNEIHVWGDYNSDSAGIVGTHDLKIVLNGTNNVKNPTTTSAGACGVYVNGDLTVEGSGTLDAQGYKGIYAEGSMTVDGGTVNATSTHVQGIGVCTNSNSGGITINDGALTAIGGDIGIAAYFGTSGNVIVNGGTVTATGKNGIMADYVTINGGTVNVTANGDHTSGIYSYNNISIEGGTVTAIDRGNKSTGIYGSEGVTIGEGSTVTAAGSGCGIRYMVKNAIVGIGWTDVDGTTDKTDIGVSEQGQTLDYKHVRFPAYIVTYKVVNGTWSDGKTADIEESVASGMKPASVPTGMKASEGYTGGSWDKNPADTAITGATTFTYTFTPAPAPSADSSGTLLAKVTAKGSKALNVTWTKMDGADGYDVFLSRCNRSGTIYIPKLAKSIKGNGTFKWTKKGLKKKKAYKVYVKAWVMKNGQKTYISKSPGAHAYTGGWDRKYTNPKSVKVNQSAVTLNQGGSVKIKASVKKLKKGKKLISTAHAAKLRYLSSDPKVAAVSDSGMITAKSTGSCTIFVIAANGVNKSVAVTVR